MFYEGDEVTITNLNEEVKEMLSDALECEFEDIEFYFVEYHDEAYAVLSAETDLKFAIIHCPLSAMEGYYNDNAEVEKLLTHVVNTHILNRALDTRDKKLFQAVLNYDPYEEVEDHEHVYLYMIEDLSDEEWDDLFGDGK